LPTSERELDTYEYSRLLSGFPEECIYIAQA